VCVCVCVCVNWLRHESWNIWSWYKHNGDDESYDINSIFKMHYDYSNPNTYICIKQPMGLTKNIGENYSQLQWECCWHQTLCDCRKAIMKLDIEVSHCHIHATVCKHGYTVQLNSKHLYMQIQRNWAVNIQVFNILLTFLQTCFNLLQQGKKIY